MFYQKCVAFFSILIFIIERAYLSQMQIQWEDKSFPTNFENEIFNIIKYSFETTITSLDYFIIKLNSSGILFGKKICKIKSRTRNQTKIQTLKKIVYSLVYLSFIFMFYLFALLYYTTFISLRFI